MASALSSSIVTPGSGTFTQSTRAGLQSASLNGRTGFACHVGLRKVHLSSAIVPVRHERTIRCQGVRAKESEPGFFQKIGTAVQKANKKAPEPEPEVERKGTGWFKLGASKASGTQRVTRGTGGLYLKGTRQQKATGTAKTGTTQRLAALAQGFVQRVKPTDPKTVFVSGATGQTGVRVVKDLLAAGLSVRAGVPNTEEADRLLDFAVQYELISREEAKRVNVVQYDVADVNSIAGSIANAGKVVLALGPAENSPRGRLGNQDALRVLEAAKLANSSHFVLVSGKGGSGGGGGGFFGGLFGGGGGAVSDKGLVEKLAESGLAYTVVRAGPEGESEGNTVVGGEGAALTGKVSKAQVAEVVAAALADLEVSKNKVVEVSSSANAPSTAISELLRAVPEDGRYGEVLAARKAEEEAAAAAEQRAREAEEEAQRRAQAQDAARAAAEEAAAAEARKKELEAEAKQMQAIGARAQAARERARARVDSAGTAVQSVAAKAEQMNLGPLDTRAVAARKGTSSFGFSSLFSKAEQGAEDAAEEVAGTAKKVAARGRAQPVVRKAARSEPAKEVKKAAGGFDFGSLLSKKEEVVDEPVQDAKKSAFAFGSLLKKKAEEGTNGAAAKVQRSRPAASAAKRVARVGSQVQKAAPKAPVPKPAAVKKGGKGGLFGGLLPSEDEYLYED